jgi:hypothetical protein
MSNKYKQVEQEGQEEWLSLIARKVNGIRFGSVHVVVHDGKVMQVEVTEKTRFQPGRVLEYNVAS